MRSKKKKLKYTKERLILSDVLPYEIPITLSNRHFYDFLVSNKVEYKDSKVTWIKSTNEVDLAIKLFFGLDKNESIVTNTVKLFDRDVEINSIEIDSGSAPFVTVPFGYKISHKENEYRQLAICHPRNQVQLVDFFDYYKELILYYSSVSPFSMRRASRVSKYTFHKDKTHYDTLSDEMVSIEEVGNEYENLRSFFVYKDVSNVYKFYESYRYHRCEKKYNKLLKLDISKCFDSIYTHSLSWAILGKDSVKENLPKAKSSFSGKFDNLMQSLNYNETNGIIIGPEFSRIFAELILQAVDRDLLRMLKRPPYELIHKVDYEIFRYVDDYFVFYNEDSVKGVIEQELKVRLGDYKLYMNRAKAEVYEKPIITNITIAKSRIAKLISDKLAYKIEEILPEEGGDDEVEKQGSIYIKSSALITKFKVIIKESKVDYKDIQNYTLSIVERKCIKIIKDYKSIQKRKGTEKELLWALISILEFTFFIYSVTPRVNSTIKLCRILRTITAFMKREEATEDYKNLVFKLVYDNIDFILNKYKNTEHAQVETLYLLVALTQLGKEYWLDVDVLCAYFDIEKKDGKYRSDASLNYLSMTVLLFYMRDKKRYIKLRDYIENAIKDKFIAKPTLLAKDTELIMLLFDSITCPYLSMDTKRYILNLYDVDGPGEQDALIGCRKYWFTKWSDFDLGRELDAKQSQEVY